MDDKCRMHSRNDGVSWEEYDARGIYLCRVCDKCKAEKLAGYRSDVINNPGYQVDEDIDPEPYYGSEGEW